MTCPGRFRCSAILWLIVAAACSKAGSPEQGVDSAGAADMAGMPGMKMPMDSNTKTDSSGKPPVPATLTFTRAQLEHGKIQWARPTTGTIGSSAAIPGELVPDEDHTVRLGAPVRGQVIDVLVRPGDRVAAGQALMRLRSPEAGMAQAEVARAAAEVTSRRAQLQYAESARARAERLLALKAISRQDYERAVADADQARAALAQAEADERRAKATAEQIGATSSVSGEVVVRTSIAGVVLDRTAVPGTVVEAGTPLVVVTNPAVLWLSIAAPEQLTPLFRRGGRVRFTVSAYPGETFSAVVDAVGAGLDPVTRTLSVRAVVTNRDGRLKPAMLATVTADGSGSANMVIVPEDAVQVMNSMAHVFVVHPDDNGGARIDRRVVTTGPHQNGRIAILRGVTATDTVVTEGAFAVKAQFLKGGMPKMDM